jgi:uncharacterized protein
LKRVITTPSGAGLFLGNDEKTFVIYVDLLMGEQINLALKKQTQPRPLTFDFVRYVLQSFEIAVKTVVIYKTENGVFYARVVMEQQNTLQRIAEMDIRTSDAILLALTINKPIFIADSVFEQIPDATEILNNFNKLISR